MKILLILVFALLASCHHKDPECTCYETKYYRGKLKPCLPHDSGFDVVKHECVYCQSKHKTKINE